MKRLEFSEASIIAYRQPFQFGSLAGIFGLSSEGEPVPSHQTLEIDVSERLLPRLQPGVLYFLMPPLTTGDGAGDFR